MWLLLACGTAPPSPPPVPRERAPVLRDAPPYRLHVRVDVRDRSEGSLQVVETFEHLRSSALSFAQVGGADLVGVSDLEVTVAGASVPVRVEGGRFAVDAPGEPIVLSYRVTPGGVGRHGRQGLVSDRYAMFDGRVLLLPRAESPVGSVDWRFDLPEGWTVASALAPVDGAFVLEESPGRAVLASLLETMCVGLGPFEETAVVVGATTVKSFVHAGVADEVKARLHRETASFAAAFHGALGFDPGGTLAFVRAPADGQRVFGGAWARGACFEDVKPGDPSMNTRLLGHRFAHPSNRYAPSGWLLRDARDVWFEEGHAGWAEIAAGLPGGLYGGAPRPGGGLEPPEFWYSRMYADHLAALDAHPEWVLPLARDDTAADPDQREYLHYTLAPLAVRLLDHLLHERGHTDLAAVTRALSATHSGHRSPVPLREAVDRAGNARYADWWRAVADAPAHLAPTWPGYVDDAMRARAAEPPIAWSVGPATRAPVTAAYLALLAARPGFESYRELEGWVAAEAGRRDALAARGVTLAHPEVYAALAGIPVRARDELVLAERGWPVEGGPDPGGALAWGDTPDAALWQELLAVEAAYEAHRGARSELRAVTVAAREKGAPPALPTLLVPRDGRMEVEVRWLVAPPVTRLELVQGDEVVTREALGETRFNFHPQDRPNEEGLLRIRVTTARGEVVERALWVR